MQDTLVWPATGTLFRICIDRGAVRRIEFLSGAMQEPGDADPLLTEAKGQLQAYLEGRLRDFDLPLAPEGTTFQFSVWDEVARIPYGEVRTYSDVAVSVGNPAATRAVGAANGANPIPIVIPCHRVVRTGGALGGYGGGLPMKRALLTLEQRHAGLFATPR
jgi:methylated-DNA-[protein]-cysteine S-methyltransferase